MPEAPRVLIAIEPSMYAEVLAFSVGQKRPHAEVSLVDPSEDLEEAARSVRPHLVVANRVPKAAREGTFWVELAKPHAGRGVEPLSARISADGHSMSVDNVRTEHVLSALDRAEEELAPEGGRGRARRAAGASAGASS